jgi:pyruvate dehydrogenase E2 component (dihydrolipoamide acetyltransferase)
LRFTGSGFGLLESEYDDEYEYDTGRGMATEVKLPELAEGVEKGDVVNLMVKVGDEIDIDTPLLEVESEKATLTVPSSVKGKVTKVLIQQGQKVAVGQAILEVDSGNGAAAPKAAPAPAPKAEAPKAAAPKASTSGAPKDAAADKQETVADDSDHEGDTTGDRFERVEEPEEMPHPAPPANLRGPDELVPAGPAVRRIARELGIDLAAVQGSGRNGRITVEDLDPYIKGYISQRGNGGGAGFAPAAAAIELPDFSKFGPIRREHTDSLRRKIADKMSQSWATVPHVHQFADADVTDLMALMKRHKDRVKEAGGALTFTVFALKAVALALKQFPQFNVTYDVAKQEIVHKDYIHIGVAVDTPAGLIVPVVRDVDKKPLVQLAVELNELAQKTRDRKTGIEDLRGGSFTISNLGGIGGTYFTPIINTPEVAILGIGRSQRKPVFDEKGQVVARDICPLCVAYDHRVIDGADGARFTMRLVEILENFEAAFLGF